MFIIFKYFEFILQHINGFTYVSRHGPPYNRFSPIIGSSLRMDNFSSKSWDKNMDYIKQVKQQTSNVGSSRSIPDLEQKRLIVDNSAKLIKSYKSKLRKARFFVEKTKKTIASFTPLQLSEHRNDLWAKEVLAKEEERLSKNISLNSFVKDPSQAELARKTDRLVDVIGHPVKRKSDMKDISNLAQKTMKTSSPSNNQISRVVPLAKAPSEIPTIRYGKEDTNTNRVDCSKITQQDLKVSIVDTGASDLNISTTNFSLVEEGIQHEMYKRICEGESFAPFQMKERYMGFRIIECESEAALIFLRKAVSNLGELWSSAKLELRHLNELPVSVHIKVNLPVRSIDMKKIMRF
uniref:DUF4780 domain-containing protein n=1 Tax=Megaselia scalaris TaxID=36166 RepID=T1GGC9_MEGSC